MLDDKFIDGIGQVSVQGGTVRMELTSFETLAQADGGSAPSQVASGRLAMSLRTLVSLQKTTEEVVNQLIEKGVLKRKDSGGEADVASDSGDDDDMKH